MNKTMDWCDAYEKELYEECNKHKDCSECPFFDIRG